MGDDREDVKTLSDLSYWRHASLAGTTSGVAQTIRPSQRADLFCVTGSTLTMVTRAGNSLAVAFNSGQPVSLDGRVFASFSATATDWVYAIVPRDAIPTFPSIAPGGGGTGNLSISGSLTVQNGSSTLASKTLLAAGSTPTDILTTDSSGDLLFVSPTQYIAFFNFDTYFQNTGGGDLALGGHISSYQTVSTAGVGVPAIYAVTTTPVALQTTSTIINNSFTPGATGLFRVTVGVVPLNAFSKTGTVTVSYTDAKTTGTVTQTQNIASTTSAVPQSFVFLCNATTAAVITVAGTISTNNDAYATCTIEQLA
jgi:hypothetical protein